MSDKSETTNLQRLIQLFGDALRALGTSPSDRQLEAWSILIHASMTGGEREYHGIQHVFDVADGAGPIETLAALFHDTVYVQADGYLSKRHEALLANVMEKVPNGFKVRRYDPESDPCRVMLERVFGVEQGSILTPWWGLNEFMSAMLAIRSLKEILQSHQLVQIAAAIEATIPFRPRDQRGLSPSERLFERLERVDREFGLRLGDAGVERAVHQAVAVANRDVAGFAYEDTALFLHYTWKLLPESNMALRSKDNYTLGEYLLGLSNMAGFFQKLQPETVFFQFRSIPTADEWAGMTARAATNIGRACRYLEAKLAAVSILDALAVLTGGDAPMALFMGDLPEPGRRTIRMEDYLPAPGPPCRDAAPDVFDLLHSGRQNDSEFDLKNSPLAAFVYARIGESGVARLLAKATHPMDTTLAGELLESISGDLVSTIARACAITAMTRKKELLGLASRLDR